jgi:hypothetical protein
MERDLTSILTRKLGAWWFRKLPSQWIRNEQSGSNTASNIDYSTNVERPRAYLLGRPDSSRRRRGVVAEKATTWRKLPRVGSKSARQRGRRRVRGATALTHTAAPGSELLVFPSRCARESTS